MSRLFRSSPLHRSWEIYLRRPNDITPTEAPALTNLCTVITYHGPGDCFPGSDPGSNWLQEVAGSSRGYRSCWALKHLFGRTKLSTSPLVYVDPTREIVIQTWVQQVFWGKTESCSMKAINHCSFRDDMYAFLDLLPKYILEEELQPSKIYSSPHSSSRHLLRPS